MSQRDLNIRLADLVDEMIDGSPRDRLLHVRQLRDAVQSIAANISEGQSLAGKPRRRFRTWGRIIGQNRIAPKSYWPRHNLRVVIVKMLTSLLGW
jgi:hypothetical protein